MIILYVMFAAAFVFWVLMAILNEDNPMPRVFAACIIISSVIVAIGAAG